MMADSIQMET